jgi:Domain of unknown function (DUF4442)
MTDTTRTYRLWKTLASRPGGTRAFSAAAMLRVPYFASIVPHVRRMEPGFAEVSVPKWFYVHNHLGTVHAIASSNAAELAMGMLVTSLMAEADSFVGLTQPQILLCGAPPDAARRTSPIPNGTLPVSNDKSRRDAAKAPIPPTRRRRRRCAHRRASTRPFVAITDGVDLVVPVCMLDEADTEAVHADITTWVTPRT